jgi:CBS domain-containing protein
MTQRIKDVMTPNPVTVDASTPIVEAAKAMRQNDIGAVVVMDGGKVSGVVTDRDIVVRAIADGADPRSTQLRQACSSELVTLSPDDDVDKAVKMMRSKSIRRVPVVSDGTAVGMVSIGDLAIEKDPDSALAAISAAPANR